ncbi:MAG: hypothetical protein AAGD05_06630 [Bacteroidota bacterium]
MKIYTLFLIPFLFFACASDDDVLPTGPNNPVDPSDQMDCQGTYRIAKILWTKEGDPDTSTIALHYGASGLVDSTDFLNEESSRHQAYYINYDQNNQRIANGNRHLGHNPTLRYDYVYDGDRLVETHFYYSVSPGPNPFYQHTFYYEYEGDQLVGMVKKEDTETIENTQFFYSEQNKKVERITIRSNDGDTLHHEITKFLDIENFRKYLFSNHEIPQDYLIDTSWIFQPYGTPQVHAYSYVFDAEDRPIEAQLPFIKETYIYECQ